MLRDNDTLCGIHVSVHFVGKCHQEKGASGTFLLEITEMKRVERTSAGVILWPTRAAEALMMVDGRTDGHSGRDEKKRTGNQGNEAQTRFK